MLSLKILFMGIFDPRIFDIRDCAATAALFGETQMFKTLMNTLMALLLASGMALTSATTAEAGHRGVGLGIATGIIGLGILGAAAASAHPRYYSRYDDDGDSCYYGRRECHWTGRHCFENRWGDEVCRGGRYVCERPLICD